MFKFVQSTAPTKKKNMFLHKLLVYMGLREEEEEIITEEEKIRRYNIAMGGWKKVKKTLTVIRYRGYNFKLNYLTYLSVPTFSKVKLYQLKKLISFRIQIWLLPQIQLLLFYGKHLKQF